MKSCSKTSYVSLCHLGTIIDVCNKSKTVHNLHETIAGDNNEKKGRSSYNWFITYEDWDEEEVAQRNADLFFERLASKKVTGYYSFIPFNRSGQPIL